MGVLLVVAAVAGQAGPAAAQEWKIYLQGKVQPVVADLYVEDTPWVFFHDDRSMYLFAVGCDRIDRVERSGTILPKPACPVERLATSAPRVYVAIIDLESKRLDDSIAKLRDQTRAYAQAVVGSVAALGDVADPQLSRAQAELQRRRALDAVAFLQSQINDTLFDIRLSEQRVGALLDAAKSYPRSEKARYFFFSQ
jgi:hypothetical protein